MSKQLSGAQKRKINKQKQEECKSMSQQFTKWLKKNPQIEETNISIEYNIVKDINYDDVINEFAQMKARKVQF